MGDRLDEINRSAPGAPVPKTWDNASAGRSRLADHRRRTTRTKATINAKRHPAQPCPKNTGQVGAMKESDSALLGF